MFRRSRVMMQEVLIGWFRTDTDWHGLLRGGGGLPDTAEAIDVVAEADVGIAGAFVVAISRAAILGAESPGAPAKHFVLAFVRAAWIFAGRLRVIVHLIEIIAPLPHIAGNVMESPGIGLFLAHGARVAA